MSMGPKPFRSLLEEDNSEYYETMKLDTYAGSDPAHYATGLCCQLWRKHSATSSAGATLRAADLFKLLHFCGRKAYPLSIMESSSKYGMTLFSQVFMGHSNTIGVFNEATLYEGRVYFTGSSHP